MKLANWLNVTLKTFITSSKILASLRDHVRRLFSKMLGGKQENLRGGLAVNILKNLSGKLRQQGQRRNIQSVSERIIQCLGLRAIGTQIGKEAQHQNAKGFTLLDCGKQFLGLYSNAISFFVGDAAFLAD